MTNAQQQEQILFNQVQQEIETLRDIEKESIKNKIKERKEEATKRTKDCLSLLQIETSSKSSSLSPAQKKFARELAKKINPIKVGTVSLFSNTMSVCDEEVLKNFNNNDRRLREATQEINPVKIIHEEVSYSQDESERADLDFLELSLDKMADLVK